MTNTASELTVDPVFRDFIEGEVLPGLGLKPEATWRALASLLREFSDPNKALLTERARLERAIDDFNTGLDNEAPAVDAHERFLKEIGYLAPEPAHFSIGTTNVDPELALLAGPQLVVPADNARYVLNAANARWGSLYDALYGTDAMGTPPPPPGRYDAARGSEVIAWAKAWLDETFPLKGASHAAVTSYEVANGALATNAGPLAKADAFVGYRGEPEAPTAILLRSNGLHVELAIDREHHVGSADAAGVSDIVVESALTAIIDFEDAVAAVDAADKVGVYRNWLGLIRGDLAASFPKNGALMERRLDPDRSYTAPDGAPFALRGRALLLVRNVGHLMTTPTVQYAGEDAPEGILDAFVTALVGRHDLDSKGANSATGSIYVVKPKMHGPAEAAFTRDLFAACERRLGLPPNTMKIGVMDEERRTSLNLAAVIHEVKDRIVFTNTGFLDRTGDEIHTAMKLGAVYRKDEMKAAAWFKAYEANNVDVALACGFAGRAQIGKGMWTMPDRMHDMLAQKIAHPMAGASTAWVPSPAAATLHALHYHKVDVLSRQRELAASPLAKKRDMLEPPLVTGYRWSVAEVADELDNNVQSILAYIARWIHQGVGCSKVPNLAGVALMEDRATCRISSQIIANWLRWGVIADTQFEDALARMSTKVDRQNIDTPNYEPIGCTNSIVLQAARRLVLGGEVNGYTEPALNEARQRYKARYAAA